MSLRKAVLQGGLAWSLTALQEPLVPLTKQNVVCSLPDEPVNVSSFKSQRGTSKCPKWLDAPQPRRLNKSVNQIMQFLVEKVFTDVGNDCLNLFSFACPVLLLWYLPPMQPESCHWAIPKLAKPLADHSGHIAEQGGVWDCKNWSWGVDGQRRSLRGHAHWSIYKLNPANQKVLTPFPVLGMCIPFAFSTLEIASI